MFYSAGGFPFDDDMNPTLNTPAGQYAVEIYLQEKKVAHPESAGWGTPQMIPRIASGKVVTCQYWDGTAKLNENPEKSQTVGKWLYGLVPGSDNSGKRIHRSISSPLAARAGQQVQPAQGAGRLPRAVVGYAARTRRRSCPTRSTPSTTPGHKGHMTAPTGDRDLQRRPASRRSRRTCRW